MLRVARHEADRVLARLKARRDGAREACNNLDEAHLSIAAGIAEGKLLAYHEAAQMVRDFIVAALPCDVMPEPLASEGR